MNPAKYNHKIEIIKNINRNIPNPPTDESGTPIEDWQVIKNPWCRKEGINGKGMRLPRLIYAANGSQSVITVIFTLRYTTGITIDMRVRDKNGVYEIKDIPDVNGNREEMMIITQEVINNGN